MKLRRDRIEPPRAEGIYASLITPRRDREIEMDFGAMLDLLDFVATRGASGVVLFGTTGEFLHFTTAERARFVGLAAKRSRVPVLVNVSHSTLEGAAGLAEEAAGSGAAGVVLTPPYFYRYDAETIRVFFLEVASRVARYLPVFLDNHPLTGNALPVELAVELLRSGVFAGIEESSGDWEVLGQLIALPVQVLCGAEKLHVLARRTGAAGGVSGIASAVPELMTALDRAAIAGDDAAVARLAEYLDAFLEWVSRFQRRWQCGRRARCGASKPATWRSRWANRNAVCSTSSVAGFASGSTMSSAFLPPARPNPEILVAIMSRDMPPDEFRQQGHQIVDWIADYLANIRDYRVLPDRKPGDLIDALPGSGPEQGEPMEHMLADFRNLIVPDVNHWNHPNFHGYFSITGSGPGILGEMLSAALNCNAMLWKACPAATELEQVVLDWLRQWLGLPEGLFGIIYDTASISTMTSIAAARELAFPEVRTEGGLHDAVVYTSEQAHSSIEKGAITLGVGQNNVRKIGTDAEFRMRPDLLEAAIEADKRAGKRPFYVCATVGTTATASVDPVNAIADIAEREKMWLHIDGAYGGPTAILPEMRQHFIGYERADSFLLNPHKWLFTPTDISVFYTRHQSTLRQAFALVPEYLKTADDPRALNYMDYGVQLGRRFRALKLWFVMRYFGREGISAALRSHLEMAQTLAADIQADERFEVMAPVLFSLVCFRLKKSDAANRQLLEDINNSGKAFLSHTVLNGKYTLRLAIGNLKLTPADIAGTWSLIRQLAGEL